MLHRCGAENIPQLLSPSFVHIWTKGSRRRVLCTSAFHSRLSHSVSEEDEKHLSVSDLEDGEDTGGVQNAESNSRVP